MCVRIYVCACGQHNFCPTKLLMKRGVEFSTGVSIGTGLKQFAVLGCFGVLYDDATTWEIYACAKDGPDFLAKKRTQAFPCPAFLIQAYLTIRRLEENDASRTKRRAALAKFLEERVDKAMKAQENRLARLIRQDVEAIKQGDYANCCSILHPDNQDILYQYFKSLWATKLLNEIADETRRSKHGNEIYENETDGTEMQRHSNYRMPYSQRIVLLNCLLQELERRSIPENLTIGRCIAHFKRMRTLLASWWHLSVFGTPINAHGLHHVNLLKMHFLPLCKTEARLVSMSHYKERLVPATPAGKPVKTNSWEWQRKWSLPEGSVQPDIYY
eukprot:Gregarina_sp_Poly_1__8831@NODE_530_length_7661_cov_56_450619_g420_i0_p3_GENE_NODE_530_length_7661_cov_56_450619_g420_i0NODE_530_length_7661_cov_56_450619_g420_i0_p3_ORF_typecomplete_len329_score30_58SATase_N/PF06426_14/0_088_NODE_530_length_7661_cov_56_450619_g420_i02671253